MAATSTRHSKVRSMSGCNVRLSRRIPEVGQDGQHPVRAVPLFIDAVRVARIQQQLLPAAASRTLVTRPLASAECFSPAAHVDGHLPRQGGLGIQLLSQLVHSVSLRRNRPQCQHVPDGLPQQRMDEDRVPGLPVGTSTKGTQVQAGVGQHQPGGIEHQVGIEQDIDVDQARPPADRRAGGRAWISRIFKLGSAVPRGARVCLALERPCSERQAGR